MRNGAIDIIELLEEGRTIQINPQGYSMYPMLVPGRDAAIIRKADQSKLKRGDVVLYRRDESILVLHRICKITEDTVYLVGDNQVIMEGPLRKEQIKGKLIAFIRRDKQISVNNPIYRLLSTIWLLLRPFRNAISSIAVRIRKVLHFKKS